MNRFEFIIYSNVNCFIHLECFSVMNYYSKCRTVHYDQGCEHPYHSHITIAMAIRIIIVLTIRILLLHKLP